MGTAEPVSFGMLLRRFRLAAGRTQAGLAEQSGLSERAVNDLERDPRRMPRLESVRLLADALGLSPHDRAALLAAARPHAARALALPATFSPRRTLHSARHNLPVHLTSLLGREYEVATVTTLLRQDAVRLVTLTGPGGVGKTRLGLQVAAELVDTYADGVWFVPLSRLVDPALVLPTITHILDLQEAGRQPVEVALREWLRTRAVLLLLDNFEQVAAAAPQVAELVASSPGLKVLVTSRVRLHLRGEQEVPVPPLGLPSAAGSPRRPPVERLSQYAAVALFVARAQEARPDFQVTSATAHAVLDICARLDGLPLAIELAAARLKVLPPPALLRRLEQTLPLLVGGARDLEARQQTMRATLAWSEDLLSPAEQRLFQRLSVFVGGFTLEAAEAVCAAPTGAVPLGMSVLEGLERLVDHSLVQPWTITSAGRNEPGAEAAEEEDSEACFRLLYVVREYALERLAASGETQALRRAHAAYVLALAEQADWQKLFERQGARRLAQLEQGHDNCRAALAWACEQEEIELGLRLGAALAGFWSFRGYMPEGRAWLEQLLALGTGPPCTEVAGARRVEEVERRAGQAAARAWVWALGWAGVYAMNQGELRQAVELMEETVVAGSAIGEMAAAVVTRIFLGGILLEAGDVVRGLALVEESLVEARQLEDDVGYQLNVLVQAGDNLLLVPGEEDRAAALEQESLELAQRNDQPYWEARARFVLGLIAVRHGDLAQARAQAVAALAVMQNHGVMLRVPLLLEELAIVEGREGQGDCAARLLGAATRLRETSGSTPDPALRTEVEATVPLVRAALGEAGWAAAYAAGRALSLEEAVAEALGKPR